MVRVHSSPGSLKGEYSLRNYRFDWDPQKNDVNVRKHGISFEDAQSTFYDDDALLLFDDEHSSESEERFVLIGADFSARMLMVCHCYRNGDSIVRIFSARKATKHEIRMYRGGR